MSKLLKLLKAVVLVKNSLKLQVELTPDELDRYWEDRAQGMAASASRRTFALTMDPSE